LEHLSSIIEQMKREAEEDMYVEGYDSNKVLHRYWVEADDGARRKLVPILDLTPDGVSTAIASAKPFAVTLESVVKTKEIGLQPIKAVSQGIGDSEAKRSVYFDGEFVPTPVYDLNFLAAGDSVSGPAIVETGNSTQVLPKGSDMVVDNHGNMVISLR
jgi:hypothetical protein